jgi:hypothetical protein
VRIFARDVTQGDARELRGEAGVEPHRNASQ